MIASSQNSQQPNQALNLTVDSVLIALPLHSGAFNGRLVSRYVFV